MRIIAFSLFVGALHLLNEISTVNAGFPSKMSKVDKEKIESLTSEKSKKVDVDLVLFAKYKNADGRKLAKQWAVKKRFETHIRKLRTVSLRAVNATALQVLSNSKDIKYVELEHKVKALPIDLGTEISEKLFSGNRFLEETRGYGIDMVQASELWNVVPKARMKVCVIDSGYGLGHPDLPTESNVAGTSTSTGDWNIDAYGHGTHCAGVLGAIGDNNEGVVGVLKDPSKFDLHIAKSLDDQGDGTETDVLDGFEDCVAAGANVISMSLGTAEYSATIENACKDAYDNGILILSAAGNDGNADYSYPASYPYVMSVAAVGKTGKIASFSQYNDQVEIAAPGVDIVSTVTSEGGSVFGYRSWSGTSMATPHAAGVAAMVWSHFPECTNHQIRNVLLRTARHDGGAGCDLDLGFGIVQAKRAFDMLKLEGCIAGDASPSPLSKGAIGGCDQDPTFTYPPTSAPTEFTCSDHVFVLELTTDKWATETSWTLMDSSNNVVKYGDGYRNSRNYEERLCLPGDEYMFSINDKEGDGICCTYGTGSYSVYYDGVLQMTGGGFESEETVTFGQLGLIGGPNAPPILCEDNGNWTHTTYRGKPKKCNYLANNPERRCPYEGDDGNGVITTGFVSCPLTCDTCPPDPGAPPLLDTPLPTATPTLNPTPEPSPSPTLSPTPVPSNEPTPVPTGTPTLNPTPEPSPSPTSSPTPVPTNEPTPVPTGIPTPHPTPVPSPSPTWSPTPVPTVEPTPVPTGEPTLVPTPAPTVKPTATPTPQPSPFPTGGPTMKPTQSPTSSPTAYPTAPPTSLPTLSPTKLPTATPTAAPTSSPTPQPSSLPTALPTPQPSPSPMVKPPATPFPTPRPSMAPTVSPTMQPSTSPTSPPTAPPSNRPTNTPTRGPTAVPTTLPPTKTPTVPPTTSPLNRSPSLPTTVQPPPATPPPTMKPTEIPTGNPTFQPTRPPTELPTTMPTLAPTPLPSATPTSPPTRTPTGTPTSIPTNHPTATLTSNPTSWPTPQPTELSTSSSTPVPTLGVTEAGGSAGDNSCLSDLLEDGDYSHKCGFPFEHKKKLYYSCTDEGWTGNFWCYHENGKDWGKCENTPACMYGSSSEGEVGPPPEERGGSGSPSSCEDDRDWTFTVGKKKEVKNCIDLLSDPSKLCETKGKNKKGDSKTGFESCQKTCDTCKKPKEPKPPGPAPAAAEGPAPSPKPKDGKKGKRRRHLGRQGRRGNVRRNRKRRIGPSRR